MSQFQFTTLKLSVVQSFTKSHWQSLCNTCKRPFLSLGRFFLHTNVGLWDTVKLCRLRQCSQKSGSVTNGVGSGKGGESARRAWRTQNRSASSRVLSTAQHKFLYQALKTPKRCFAHLLNFRPHEKQQFWEVKNSQILQMSVWLVT